MAEPKEEYCLSNVAQCCEVTAVYQMPATLVDVPLVCNGIDRICNTSTKRKRVVLRFGTTRLRFVLVLLAILPSFEHATSNESHRRQIVDDAHQKVNRQAVPDAAATPCDPAKQNGCW